MYFEWIISVKDFLAAFALRLFFFRVIFALLRAFFQVLLRPFSVNFTAKFTCVTELFFIHFLSFEFQDATAEDGGNYVVRAINEMGDKDCTLALNFGGPSGDEDNVPAKIYEQPELRQPDPSVLILEAHIHANPKPKITWLCNGDFVKESDRKFSKLEARPEKNKWNATLTILVSF